jgi:hypothetical protein
MMMELRPLESQVDRMEAAERWVRTEKIVLAPLSVPENEPVPLFAVPPVPGISNFTRPSPATDPSTLWTVVTLSPEDSWGDVFHLVVSVPVTVIKEGSPRGPARLVQPSSAPWVSERLPDTLPLVTVNPVALLVQSLSFALIVATVVPAASLEVSVGLNVAEPFTAWQMTVSFVAFTMGGAPALALPPVEMTPNGMAIAPATNIACGSCVCSLFSVCKLVYVL